MLYYPGFEVKDINWLKFALLYLDDLRPIIPQIPYTRENYLDSLTLKIMDSTDLIREYCPDYKEGNIFITLSLVLWFIIIYLILYSPYT